MKKMFDEDDEEFQEFDKAKIIVSVIPVILIVLILAIMLLINNRNKEDKNTDDVQQSIMDYADEKTGAENRTDNAPSALPAETASAVPSPYSSAEPEATP